MCSGGIEHEKVGEPELAYVDYCYALEINAGYVEGLNRRGALLSTQGRYQEAMADLNKAISTDPGNFFGYFLRESNMQGEEWSMRQ